MKKVFGRFLLILLTAANLVSFLAVLNRCGSLLPFWQEDPLESIQHEAGYGYYAFIQNDNVCKLRLPVFLKEDSNYLLNAPLSVNEDYTASIKSLGGGRYEVLENSNLFFSASDNQLEAHEYALVSPKIIRNRYLLACLLLSAALTGLYWITKSGSFKDYMRAQRNVLIPVFLLLFALPGLTETLSVLPVQLSGRIFLPVFRQNVAAIILLFGAAVWTMRMPFKKPILRKWLPLLLIVINLLAYFAPEWNALGLREDSFSYLEPHDASSIRTNGYPLFIRMSLALSGAGSSDNAYDKAKSIFEQFDERLVDVRETDCGGLEDVVHLQKILLGAVFLMLCYFISKKWGGIWTLFFSEVILSGGFLGCDNSYIMTECLSQTVTLLAVLAFLGLISSRKPCAAFLCAAAAGLAVFIRPANIYLGLLVCACIFVGMKRNHGRQLLKTVSPLLVFLLIAGIPSFEIYRAYGSFLWMPLSGYTEIGRAFDITMPEDEGLFEPESEELAFYRAAVSEKEKRLAAGEKVDQNVLIWDIAVPIAGTEFHRDRIECSRLFQPVSRKILLSHPQEFLSGVRQSAQMALERTRIQTAHIPYVIWLGIFVALALVFFRETAAEGLLLLVLHNAHVLLSVINQPERRYIYSTEILCLLGFFLILMKMHTKRATIQLSKPNNPDAPLPL